MLYYGQADPQISHLRQLSKAWGFLSEKVSAVLVTHSSLEIIPDKEDLSGSFPHTGTTQYIIHR